MEGIFFGHSLLSRLLTEGRLNINLRICKTTLGSSARVLCTDKTHSVLCSHQEHRLCGDEAQRAHFEPNCALR